MKKKLAIGRRRIYAIRDKICNVTNNADGIVTVAVRFYADLYASNVRPGNSAYKTNFVRGVPTVAKHEVETTLKKMKRGKAAEHDGITIDLLKDGGHILLGKLAKLLPKCLRNVPVPIAWRNATIIIIHKQDNVKVLKNYRLI